MVEGLHRMGEALGGQMLTGKQDIEYNKGVPIKCKCGAVIAFRKGDIKIDGDVLVKCRRCKRIVNIKERAESIK